LKSFVRPSEIIVYIIGGITYEESCHIHMMNNQGARIILGGSYIHNFSSFIDEVLASSSLNISAAPTVSIPLKRR
jgi:vacuolar protein sorting-associated protein 45